MSSKPSPSLTRIGDATVIRDEDTSNPVAVRFDHVNKTYKLFRNDKQRLLATFSRRVKYTTVHASDDLSFTCERGESVALIGDNGAGKSTALKMITGVCFPTSGTLEVHGRVSALLELSAGFDMRLSGMENIRMRCQLWGLSAEESKALIPEIVEFSELGKYIDQPMRTYSSGMPRHPRRRRGAVRRRPEVLEEVPGARARDHGEGGRHRAVRDPLDRHGQGVLHPGHRHPQGPRRVLRGDRRGRGLLHGAVNGSRQDAVDTKGLLRMQSKRRESNVELLRVICMMLIVMHHCCIYGPWHDTQLTSAGILIDCMSVGGKIGVDCYVLITGYYQSKSRFKVRSLIRILAQVYFYALIIFVGYCLIIHVPSMNMTVRSLFPWIMGLNWFVPPYLLLYCISPVINLAIRRLSPRALSGVVIVGFVILSAIPTVAQQSAFADSFIWFTYLYLCGAELRMLKTQRDDVRISLGKAVLNHRILLSVICLLFVFGYGCVSHLHGVSEIEYINVAVVYAQSSVPILILALVLFVSILKWDMRYSPLVNIAGKCSFGVYLIHDNPLVRESWALLDPIADMARVRYIPAIVIVLCVTIFTICAAIDYMRIKAIETPFMNCLEKKFKTRMDHVDSKVLALFSDVGGDKH